MDGSELKNGPVVGEVNQKDCQALRSVQISVKRNLITLCLSIILTLVQRCCNPISQSQKEGYLDHTKQSNSMPVKALGSLNVQDQKQDCVNRTTGAIPNQSKQEHIIKVHLKLKLIIMDSEETETGDDIGQYIPVKRSIIFDFVYFNLILLIYLAASIVVLKKV